MRRAAGPGPPGCLSTSWVIRHAHAAGVFMFAYLAGLFRVRQDRSFQRLAPEALPVMREQRMSALMFHPGRPCPHVAAGLAKNVALSRL